MTRRHFLARTAGIGASGIAAPYLNFGLGRLSAAETQPYSARALDLVGSSLVIDMLGLLTLDYQKLGRWHRDPQTFTADDHQSLRSSGITVFHPAVDLNSRDPHASTVKWLSGWNSLLTTHSNELISINKSHDLDAARSNKQIGVLLGMQNSDHFRTAADVDAFHGLGQRLSQLTYNSRNQLGSGCVDAGNLGLTELGFNVVERMNAVGMIVDVSHAGDHTCLDAFSASSKPVLITHSNCRALVPHPRCKSDEVITAMAKRGGVIGITGIRIFTSRRASATIEDVLDHFDHVIRLVGIDHVGIGSDTDLARRPTAVEGLNHSRRVFDLTEGLIRRGYTDVHIQQILGGNFRRAIQQILG